MHISSPSVCFAVRTPVSPAAVRAFVLEARTLLRLRGIAAYRIGWGWPSPSHCRRSQTYRTGARPGTRCALRLSPSTCTTPASGVRTGAAPVGRLREKGARLQAGRGRWLPTGTGPCARRYAVTKCLAEEIVAQAVCARGLRAVTLRPRAIFGEDDELLFPKLVDRSVTPPPVLRRMTMTVVLGRTLVSSMAGHSAVVAVATARRSIAAQSDRVGVTNQ